MPNTGHCLHTNMTGIFREAKQRFLEKLNESDLAQDRFKSCSFVTQMIRDIVDNIIAPPDYIVRRSRHDKIKLFKKKMVNVSEIEVKTVYLEVVPLECAFDIVFEAHCDTKHGSAQQVFNTLQKKYLLPLRCVEMVISECIKCSRPNEAILERGIGEWKISILDVSDIHMLHNPLKQQVLFIVDYHTNFTLLRPIPGPSTAHLSEELSQVFSEYGFPEKILVPQDLQVLEDVVDQIWLTKGAGKEKISVEPFFEEVFAVDGRRMMNELVTWSLGTEDALLQLGCVVVPFALNNTNQAIEDPLTDELTFGIPVNMFYRRKNLWDNYTA
ncbi:hypothetical protein B5X24_HaOG203064 [Helicoverpa armigera]|uniref:Integrase catalytic domain-containing protein n=1 Tax=Helicoverpa armigera TaxID=29058 RepID=A0A2W1BWX1_HELAM|nr:hypothetical protein B5X24_HaOG203064 [Helicoverpa armigera]